MIQLGTLAIWPQAVCFILISVSSAIIDAFFTVESVIRGTYVYSHFIRLPHEHKILVDQVCFLNLFFFQISDTLFLFYFIKFIYFFKQLFIPV